MTVPYRAKSKKNKQQSAKRIKNCDTSSRIKEADHNKLESLHTQTHTQNEQPYLQFGTVKLQKATSDIKSRLANFKGAPGKVLWKNPSRKKE